jgi:hypothetical protein
MYALYRYRYTLWTKWNGKQLAPIWTEVVGEELYDHSEDTGFDTGTVLTRVLPYCCYCALCCAVLCPTLFCAALSWC